MRRISRNEVRELMGSGASYALVEALPENYYAESHLPGAISLPPGHVGVLAAQMLPDKQQMIVVYCASNICQNSLLAAEELKGIGYTNVWRYEEGKEDWREAGLPLEHGPAFEDDLDDLQAAAK